MRFQNSEQSFRLISIEPLANLESQVRNVATDHGFSLKSGDATTHVAPFCGQSYFCQEMTLSGCKSKFDMVAQIEKCLATIEEIAAATVADGYVEFV